MVRPGKGSRFDTSIAVTVPKRVRPSTTAWQLGEHRFLGDRHRPRIV